MNKRIENIEPNNPDELEHTILAIFGTWDEQGNVKTIASTGWNPSNKRLAEFKRLKEEFDKNNIK